MIELADIILRKVAMKMKTPFVTSFGKMSIKDFFIIQIIDKEGNSGFGESEAFTGPWYTEETVETVRHMLEDFLIPLLIQSPVSHPDDLAKRFSPVRGNRMAKAALEGAVWDLYAKRQKRPLFRLIGGEKRTVNVGAAIGIQPTVEELLEKIDQALSEGYKRIKIKVKPGTDIAYLEAVRRRHPNVPLMIDANSSYSLKDIDQLRRFDDYGLLMIEQPLGNDDFLDHAALQKAVRTPICLDESIHSYEDARVAIRLNACKIVNIKIARVGGIGEAKKIHDLCRRNDIPVWCGGMLEAGVGRAQSLAVSTLPGFTIPGDTAGSARYWEKDIIVPEVAVSDGTVRLPEQPGIGYDVDFEALERFTISEKRIKV